MWEWCEKCKNDVIYINRKCSFHQEITFTDRLLDGTELNEVDLRDILHNIETRNLYRIFSNREGNSTVRLTTTNKRTLQKQSQYTIYEN